MRRSLGASARRRSVALAPLPRGSDAPTRLQDWDKKYLWHPFTQQTEWAGREPVVVTAGRGVWLSDSNGRRFLDGNSSLWVNVWGHRNPNLDRALRRQLGKIAHGTFLGLTHEPAIRLAQRLVSIAPEGLSRVFYSDNGSTAVEVALKMAYQYWQLVGKKQKTRFVSLKDGYHGDTLGAVSVGGVPLFHERFKDLLFTGFQVRPGDIDQLAELLKKNHASIAALVMEPLMQGASGMRVMPEGYLAQVARLCKKYGVLLILDEVATAFGRTGTMFACEQERVSPDFLCVAKSLTGGYLPLAATLSKERIYRAFLGRYEEFKAFFHGHTYTANPLACAVALENLRLYDDKNLLERVAARVRQFLVQRPRLLAHPHIKDVRSVGLMIGIELVAHKIKGTPYAPALRVGLAVCDAALRRGVWLRPLGDVIVLMPPLAISKREWAFLIEATLAAIEDVTGHRRQEELEGNRPKIRGY